MAGLTADIRFVCKAHVRGVPIITLHEGEWAYCPGGDVDAHDHAWIAIPGARVSQLESKQVGSISERLVH